MSPAENTQVPAGAGHMPVPAKGPKILVVDDFESVRLYHMSYLRRKGYRCIAASDGEEALRLLVAEQADLVLLDLHMPVLDGRQFLERARACPNCSSIPVLVITSDGPTDPLRDGTKLAGVEVLRKPLAPDDLLAAVRRLIPVEGPRDAS